ncbi:MAG: Kae1-associated serine/threonine protein kinase [Thermoplasmata archaeon]|nr:Kae1-associated serine/threonine protein kinase [Thermoplasmata archaeon]
MTIIAQGAEAKIHRGRWHGREVIIKERVSKAYRPKELDMRLRNSRLKAEAQLISQARKAGVRTPLIYDIDLEKSAITMEFIDGPTAKDVLQNSDDREELAALIGQKIGRLHNADLIHGDLTTSNMLFIENEPCFIDFGLGEKSPEPEKKGVDMHLLKEALQSAHSEHSGLYEIIANSYVEEYTEGKKILKIVEEIEKRGRYT